MAYLRVENVTLDLPVLHAESEGAAKKLQIDSIRITGAKVNLALPLLKGKTTTVPLQDIQLSNRPLTTAKAADKAISKLRLPSSARHNTDNTSAGSNR